ncbi:LexA family protein [Vreelandella titanicae]|uniref:LexA family protein n=1 Tax=Vreelandella titanicae TaxID=664683 RepID=UPI00241DF258|nr:S24 family peptidase [Halomonas titanicae]
MNLQKLSDALDRHPSQCSSFAGRNPTKNIGEKLARHIEQKLSLPSNYLDDIRNAGIHTQENSPVYHLEDASVLHPVGHMLPVIGMATAGALKEAFEEADIEEYVPAPGPCSNRAFVLILDGISMLPDFNPRDRIVIDPEAEWMSGDVVYARCTQNNSGTFKEIRYEDGNYYLCAKNPKWEPQYMKMDDTWEVVGKGLYLVKVL